MRTNSRVNEKGNGGNNVGRTLYHIPIPHFVVILYLFDHKCYKINYQER